VKRPSCFGQPSILSFTAATCTACAARTDCIRDSYTLLVELAEHFDLKGELELYRVHAGDLIANAPAPVATPVAPATSQPAPSARVDDASRFSLPLSGEQIDRIKGLPVKVGQKVRALMQGGIDRVALAELKRGKNPFSGHPSLKVAGDLLLAGQTLSTAALKTELQAQFQWSEGTAASRASSTIGVLKAIGVLPDMHSKLAQG
jgi:hypothetical protein